MYGISIGWHLPLIPNFNNSRQTSVKTTIEPKMKRTETCKVRSWRNENEYDIDRPTKKGLENGQTILSNLLFEFVGKFYEVLLCLSAFMRSRSMSTKIIQCNGISSALAMRMVQRVETKQNRQWLTLSILYFVSFVSFSVFNENKKFRNVLN